MNTIRTTITFHEALYRQLAVQAAVMGVGLSDLVNRKLTNVNAGTSDASAKQKIRENRAFFRALGKKLGRTDWTKLVREERDRDNG